MMFRFLDPAALARIGNLELVAKRVVEGFLTGRHRSVYHGFSVEFLDHRAYVPGDDPRMLDWKILARSDKYQVKLFEDETNLRATILLDGSRSMAFQSGGISKLTYGCYLAAALTYLLIRQNDAVGLMRFDTAMREVIPPQAHPTQYRRVLQSLDHITAGGETDLGSVLHEAAERVGRRGLVVVISDLIDDVEQIASGLQHFRHNHHEVIVFQTLDSAELEFPYRSVTHFRDMEGNGRLVTHPRRMRRAYQMRMKRFLDDLRDVCFERGISYNLVPTDQPYDQFLAAYLDKRSRLG